MKVEPSEYYDRIYKRMASNPNTNGWKWMKQRIAKVSPLIVGGSVLDLGCGLAVIADHTEASYYGIDSSPVAYEWNVLNVKNPLSVFGLDDLYNAGLGGCYDTVLMLEILEHIAHPQVVCDKALEAAQKRIIVTVPIHWVGTGHYKPKWTENELNEMLGGTSYIEKFGGLWWLAVKDV